jgi:hypothetical protein
MPAPAPKSTVSAREINDLETCVLMAHAIIKAHGNGERMIMNHELFRHAIEQVSRGSGNLLLATCDALPAKDDPQRMNVTRKAVHGHGHPNDDEQGCF